MTLSSHPYFVPNGDSAKDTAILLVGTADENDLDQHDIQATNGGFNITEAVARAVYGDDFEPVEDEETEVASQTLEPGQPVVTGSPKDGSATTAQAVEKDASNQSGGSLDDDADEASAYEDWDYADIKAEVGRRQIDTESQRKEALVAALVADDEAQIDQSDEDTL